MIRFDCSINAPRAEVNTNGSEVRRVEMLNQTPGKYWPTPNHSLIRKWIQQGDITDYDMQGGASEYPFNKSIMLNPINVFTLCRDAVSGHAALIADDSFHVPLHWAESKDRCCGY